MLRTTKGLEDVWELHRSQNEGVGNTADERIANLDETTGHWIKLSANADGSSRVTNGRTSVTKAYRVALDPQFSAFSSRLSAFRNRTPARRARDPSETNQLSAISCPQAKLRAESRKLKRFRETIRRRLPITP
jgi:hypothetical protein